MPQSGIDIQELEDKKDTLDHISIILDDSDRIHGKLSEVTWENDNEDEIKHDSIVVKTSGMGNRKYIYIPLSKVRAIFPSHFSQERDQTAANTTTDWVPPIIKKKREETNKTIETHDLKWEHGDVHGYYDLQTGEPDFDWDKTEYSDYTQIYADLDYFERKRNITDIGITLLGFGISIGGTRDRDKRAKKRITSRQLASIDSVESASGEITIAGTPNQLKSSQGNLAQTMENKIWVPYVLSEDAVSNLDELDQTDWCLCWFAKDWFHVPSEYSLNTDQVIRVYGEIIDSPMETEFGNVERTIKARAAAYCGD